MTEAKHEAVIAALKRMTRGQGWQASSAARELALTSLAFRPATDDGFTNKAATGLRIAIEAAAEAIDEAGETFSISNPTRSLPVGDLALGVLALGRHAIHKGNLLSRRDQVGSFYGPGGTSGTTIAIYENQALKRLAEVLIAGAEDPPRLTRLLAALPRRPEESDEAVARVWQRGHYVFTNTGLIRSHRTEFALRANLDGVTTYQVWHEYLADLRPGVLRAVNPVRAVIADETDTPGGAHLTTLQLLSPILRDERRAGIGLSIHVNSERRCNPRIRLEFVESDSDEPSALLLQFDPAYLPTEIWWYRSRDSKGEHTRTPDQAVTIEADGYVEQEFRHIQRGERCGLSWEWPPDDAQ